MDFSTDARRKAAAHGRRRAGAASGWMAGARMQTVSTGYGISMTDAGLRLAVSGVFAAGWCLTLSSALSGRLRPARSAKAGWHAAACQAALNVMLFPGSQSGLVRRDAAGRRGRPERDGAAGTVAAHDAAKRLSLPIGSRRWMATADLRRWLGARPVSPLGQRVGGMMLLVIAARLIGFASATSATRNVGRSSAWPGGPCATATRT